MRPALRGSEVERRGAVPGQPADFADLPFVEPRRFGAGIRESHAFSGKADHRLPGRPAGAGGELVDLLVARDVRIVQCADHGAGLQRAVKDLHEGVLRRRVDEGAGEEAVRAASGQPDGDPLRSFELQPIAPALHHARFEALERRIDEEADLLALVHLTLAEAVVPAAAVEADLERAVPPFPDMDLMPAGAAGGALDADVVADRQQLGDLVVAAAHDLDADRVGQAGHVEIDLHAHSAQRRLVPALLADADAARQAVEDLQVVQDEPARPAADDAVDRQLAAVDDAAADAARVAMRCPIQVAGRPLALDDDSFPLETRHGEEPRCRRHGDRDVVGHDDRTQDAEVAVRNVDGRLVAVGQCGTRGGEGRRPVAGRAGLEVKYRDASVHRVSY